MDATIKSACDIIRRGNMKGASKYVPELTWILFLRILDEIEENEQEQNEALGLNWMPSLQPPFRWRDWAAPGGEKRAELQQTTGAFFRFANAELLPHLKSLKNQANATIKQKIISEILSGVERVGINRETNFLNVLDTVDALRQENVDDTHVFALSQVYENLLLKMGEKNNDSGQFFTPREVIRAMVQTVNPEVGETVYDPCCGTGGFLAQSYEHMKNALGKKITAQNITKLKEKTFYGREQENSIYPIALANLVLHEIDYPHIWHGNTLSGHEDYGGLFEGAPSLFDVVLTNPPFGAMEGVEAQTNFDFKTTATQVLFLQTVIKSLKEKGRCGIVADEGLLFRTNEQAFTQTKRHLLEECNLWCVVSLPGGVFTKAGAGVKTNLLFFTKGEPTKRIWYYDMSDIKVNIDQPLTLTHFADFFKLLPKRADSENSWTVDIKARIETAIKEAKPLHKEAEKKTREKTRHEKRLAELRRVRGDERDQEAIKETMAAINTLKKEASDLKKKAVATENAAYDLKAANPNKQPEIDTRTPEELLDIIEAKGREINEALKPLRLKLSRQ